MCIQGLVSLSLKKRQDLDGKNVSKDVPRPYILAKYQEEMGHVDRHNQYRQGLLHQAKFWKTKKWQTRIRLELLGLIVVDAFLACRFSMPQWKHDPSDQLIKNQCSGSSFELLSFVKLIPDPCHLVALRHLVKISHGAWIG
jgi:hypothetical protein